jgi:LysR family transcriptional regulator, transcriptional activator of the cysJI operon
MKLHQLKIFQAVAEQLSVTKAANVLNMSQPAVSLQLKLLEKEYGATFYERNKHGMKLTAQGLKFLLAVRPVLEHVTKLELEFDIKKRKSQPDILNIGANHTFSVILLPEIIIEFKKSHPETTIVARTNSNNAMEEGVVSSEVDIALITHATFSPHCAYEAYRELEVVAFVRADSPLGTKSMSLSELTQNPLVVRRGSAILHEFIRSGYKLNLALQCDATEAVKIAIRSGLGVGLLFRPRIGPEIVTHEFRIIDVPELKTMNTKSFIVYDRRRGLSHIARDFVEELHRRQF